MGRNKGPKKKLVAFRVTEQTEARIKADAKAAGLKPATLLALEQERKTAEARPEQVTYVINLQRNGVCGNFVPESGPLDAQFARVRPRDFAHHNFSVFTEDEPDLEPWNENGVDEVTITIRQFFNGIQLREETIEFEWTGETQSIEHVERPGSAAGGWAPGPEQCSCTAAFKEEQKKLGLIDQIAKDLP